MKMIIFITFLFFQNLANAQKNTSTIQISGGGGGGVATLPPVKINYNQYNKYGLVPNLIGIFSGIEALKSYAGDLKKLYDPNYREIYSEKLPDSKIIATYSNIKISNGKASLSNFLKTIRDQELELEARLSELVITVKNNKQNAQLTLNRSVKYGSNKVDTWATPKGADDLVFNSSSRFEAKELNVNDSLYLGLKYKNTNLKSDNNLTITISAEFEKQCVKIKGSNLNLCVKDLAVIYDDIFFATGLRNNCTAYLCTHSEMSIMSQLSNEMYSELEKSGETFEKDKNGNKVDNFACGSVSSAMLLSSAAKESALRKKQSTYSVVQEVVSENMSTADKRTLFAKMSVFSGKLVKTNYKNKFNEKNAGTLLKNIAPGVLKFWNADNSNKLREVEFRPQNIGAFTVEDPSGKLNTIISKYNFFNTLPHVNLLITNDPKSWGHYVVWHGFDATSHIAFDPYGRITRFKINHKGQVEADLKSGTMGYEQNLRIVGISGLNTQLPILQ